jgi:hypothetical protein
LSAPGSRDRLVSAGVTLKLEAVTAEVVAALRDARIAAIVLKGAAASRWLYGEDARHSSDVDLLVAPSAFRPAEGVLASLGFTGAHGDEHARDWRRARDGMVVDLHETIVGATVPQQRLWDELARETETVRMGGREVDILNPPGRALHVALHAAQHGVEVGSAIEDLGRALERVPHEVWDGAAVLAARLHARPAFAAGLRLLPAGEAVAERLGLPVEISAEIALRARTPPPVALGFYQLATTHGFRNKAALVLEELAPPPSFMRARFPRAARTRPGLAAAYVWRPLWLLWHTGPALQAWRRAGAESRRSRG